MGERTKLGDRFEATVERNAGSSDSFGLQGVYTAECYDKDGNLKWSDNIQNLTTNVGRQTMLNSYFGLSGAPGVIYMGLMGVGAPAYTDTQSSHPSWQEVGGANAPTYSGVRKVPTFTAANSANPSVLTTTTNVVFTMTGSGTIAGAFLNFGGSSAKDDTTGILFSAGDFTAGQKVVTPGDTVNVTYTLSAAG